MSTTMPKWLRSACAHCEDWAHILKVLCTLTLFFLVYFISAHCEEWALILKVLHTLALLFIILFY
jgi:hypothetical protein